LAHHRDVVAMAAAIAMAATLMVVPLHRRVFVQTTQIETKAGREAVRARTGWPTPRQ